MSTTVIHIKLDTKTKNEAKEIAHEFGLTLTTLIKALLKQITRTRQISLKLEEEPTKFMIDALKESKEDIKAGRVSSGFDSVKDAIDWLENPDRKYANQIRKKIR